VQHPSFPIGSSLEDNLSNNLHILRKISKNQSISYYKDV